MIEVFVIGIVKEKRYSPLEKPSINLFTFHKFTVIQHNIN